MGGLVPNLTRITPMAEYTDRDNLTTGLASVMVRQEIYQDLAQRRELICEQEITSTNAAGEIILRELSEWDYDTASHLPLYEKRTTYALCWLPKVNERGSLIKVEEQWTRYWCHPPYMAQSWRTERSCYVIYDLAPTAGDVSAASARGYRVDAATRHIIDSARDWRSATKAVSVIEDTAKNQEAIWVDPIETIDHRADEDFMRILEWEIRHDRLRDGPPEVSGPTVTLKAPFEVNIDPHLVAPKLTAGAAGDAGVRLEITGGGGEVTRVWPLSITEVIAPERYVVLRKVTTAPAAPTDPYRLLESTGTVDVGVNVGLTVGSAEDFSDPPVPVNPLPSATPLAKPDQVADPEPEEWTQIAEGDNQETDTTKPGRLLLYDPNVGDSGAYAYKAVAIWQQTESPPSNVETVTYTGNRTAGLDIWTSHRKKTIEVASPLDPGFGETRVIDVPAALSGWPDGPGVVDALGVAADDATYGTETSAVDVAPEASTILEAYPEGLTDVVVFGSEVAARQFQRYADAPPQTIDVVPTVVLPMLERGQTLSLAALAATIYQAGSSYSLTLDESTWRVEGFGWTVERSGDDVKVTCAAIQCEALPGSVT